jgi:hypothetical protein
MIFLHWINKNKIHTDFFMLLDLKNYFLIFTQICLFVMFYLSIISSNLAWIGKFTINFQKLMILALGGQLYLKITFKFTDLFYNKIYLTIQTAWHCDFQTMKNSNPHSLFVLVLIFFTKFIMLYCVFPIADYVFDDFIYI